MCRQLARHQMGSLCASEAPATLTRDMLPQLGETSWRWAMLWNVGSFFGVFAVEVLLFALILFNVFAATALIVIKVERMDRVQANKARESRDDNCRFEAWKDRH